MKIFRLVITTLCLVVLCTGCWDKQELEDGTFAVLLGLDKADGNNLMMTVAFPLTQLEGGKQGEGGNSGEYSIMSVKAPSVTAGLDILGSKLAGPLSLHSVKTVVISQELAENGMISHMFSAWQYDQIRNTTSVLISACKAGEFIDARVKDPSIDVLRQEELLLEQANKSSFYKPLQFIDFIINLNSPDRADSAVMLGGIAEDEKSEKQQSESKQEKPEDNKIEIKEEQSEETNTDEKAKDEKSEQEGKSNPEIKEPVKKGYLPGEIPVKADNRTQICGLAVFSGDKMVGNLDSDEAQTYALLTSGKARKILILPNPSESESYITAVVQRDGAVAINSRIENGMPVFDINFNLRCTVEQMPDGIEAEFIKGACLKDVRNLIEKIQKEYNADILKLGNKLTYHFLTVNEWKAFNWSEKYKDAEINVSINLKRTEIY